MPIRVDKQLLLVTASRSHVTSKSSTDNSTRKWRAHMKSPPFRVTNDLNNNNKNLKDKDVNRIQWRLIVHRCAQGWLIVPTTAMVNKPLYHPRKQLLSPIWIKVMGQRPFTASIHNQLNRQNKTLITTRNKIDYSTRRVSFSLRLCTIHTFVNHLSFKSLCFSLSLSLSVAYSFPPFLILYVFVINSWKHCRLRPRVGANEREKKNSLSCRTSAIGLKVPMTCQGKKYLIVLRFIQRVGERQRTGRQRMKSYCCCCCSYFNQWCVSSSLSLTHSRSDRVECCPVHFMLYRRHRSATSD